jgi:signal transduction histidine kinase
MRNWKAYLFRGTALTVAYVVLGKVSVLFDTKEGLAPAWIPAGVCLAVLFIYGIEYWPAVFLGSFFIDAWNTGSPVVALVTATGGTIEIVAAVYLLKKLRFNKSLARLTDITSLLLVATSTAVISASLGSLGLYLGGLVSPHQIYFTWLTWWGGDTIGILIVSSLIFAITSKVKIEKTPWKMVEAILLIVFFLVVSFDLFSRKNPGTPSFPMTYFVFPLLLWSAMRFGQLGVGIAGILLAAVASWGTTRGTGPFGLAPFTYGFFQLQLFLGISSITSLTMAALVIQIREAIHLRDEFLSIASHELKTPLTSLQLHIHLIERMIKSELNSTSCPEKLKATLKKANSQVGRITNLVNDLLDVTKITAGKSTFNYERVNLSILTKELVERFTEALSAANCSIEISIDETINGYWDPMKVEQIIVNLLTNAIKYAPGKPIKIMAHRDGQNMTLVVQDSGPGIDKESLEKIFNRFERVASARNVGGLGLGLFIIKQITEAHHGRIHVESKVGHGSQFILDLPLNPKGPAWCG